MSNAKARHLSRERLLQALYQWQLSGDDITVIDRYFQEGDQLHQADRGYFSELLLQIHSKVDELDRLCAPFLERSMEFVDPVERAILMIGVYELCFRPELPYRVAINEGVELAKAYGAEQGHRFVNGVLDKVAAQARSEEVAAKKRPRTPRAEAPIAKKTTPKSVTKISVKPARNAKP